MVVAEGLAAEAGLDGHDEHKVDFVEVGQQCFGLGIRVEADAAVYMVGTDAGEGIGYRIVGLDMDCNVLRSGFGEGIDVQMGVIEHQVGIEIEGVGMFAQVVHSLGAEREVGDEVPVHDVKVDPVEAVLGNDFEGIGQV